MTIIKILFIVGINFKVEEGMLSLLSRLKEEELNLPANVMFKVKSMCKYRGRGEEGKRRVREETNKKVIGENTKNHKFYFLLIMEKDIRNLWKCLIELILMYGCISKVKDNEMINKDFY